MIYLDNSATTKLHPEVVEAMLPYLQEEFGNPSSKHYTLAVNANKAVEKAREQVSQLVGCNPEEVVFTSGATESINMILKGVMDYYDQSNHLVVSKAEHSAVLNTAKYLEQKGYELTLLDVDQFGRIKVDELETVVSSSNKPLLVSVIWGNNELGSLNNIDEIAKTCIEHGVFVHSDATQVVGKVDIRESSKFVNFLSLSSHKFHGPKGIGASIIRKNQYGIKTKLTPLIHGGGQENNYRSGTLSVHNIVGFGKAAEIALRDLNANIAYISRLESILVNELKSRFSDIITFNSDSQRKVPGIVNVRFKGVDNEFVIKELAERVAISTGSACSSAKPSHVLESIGLNLNEIMGTIRISISKFNTEEDIIRFIDFLTGN